MNQRRDARFALNQPVTVRVIGEPDRREPGWVKNAACHGVAIELQCRIEPGTAIGIEFADSMVPGEVVYCNRGPDAHLLGVELDEVLCSLTQLGRKLQALSDQREIRTEGGERPERRNMPIP